MIKTDYYLILGVPRRASFRGIQDAFRELAKKYYPDRAGPEGTRTFQDISEAYEVLSDRKKRRRYNQDLAQQEEKAPEIGPEPARAWPRTHPEPLIPEPMSVLHGFETMRPSFEPLFERFQRNFTGRGIPKGERLEGLNVEVVLSPDEATIGVMLPIAIPVFSTCARCAGYGHDWFFPCIACNGQGVVESEETIRVQIPPMVPDWSVIEIPIGGLGIHNFVVLLHIRIAW